jgi:hypothetical protein
VMWNRSLVKLCRLMEGIGLQPEHCPTSVLNV